jgi:hypothetical protein
MTDTLRDPAPRGGNADHPIQATNLMIMKMPTAVTAVRAQDIPTRIAI